MKWKPVDAFKARQVLAVTIWWVIIGMLVELNNSVNYDPVTGKHFTSFLFGNSLFQHLMITAIGPLVGGLAGGSFIVFYQRDKLKGKSYRHKLIIHSGLYILFVVLCIIVVGMVGALHSPVGSSYKERFYNDVFSLRIVRLLITWYFIVICTTFFLDVSEKYGPGTLSKLLRGKYYSPLNEERIFMFLDMKSSTTITEALGDEKYFKMLHFFFQMANEAIINNFGTIYQYIGDEIIVSWERKEGFKNANCINCFFAINDIIQKNASLFLDRYGVVPQFKAGIHAGRVASGEIGTIKKDIVYSGDVLNATARIVSLCNEYGKDLIISEVVYEAVKDERTYFFTYLDNPVLRGKSVPLSLYAVKLQAALPV
jgi:adenylate cyclase